MLAAASRSITGADEHGAASRHEPASEPVGPALSLAELIEPGRAVRPPARVVAHRVNLVSGWAFRMSRIVVTGTQKSAASVAVESGVRRMYSHSRSVKIG